MTIIATTDFSEIAQNAVQYAANLAKAANMNLVLFHAFNPPIHASNAQLSAETFQKLFDINSERLKELAKELKKEHHIETQSEITYSFVEEHLVTCIEKYNAGLLVFGMAEKSLEQELMGNTTTSAIRNINIPIISVPLETKFTPLNRVLFACDTPDEIPSHATSLIKSLIAAQNTEIEVFSVDTTVEKIKKDNPKTKEDDEKEINYYYKNIQSKEVIDEIKKEIKDFNADLLIMMPKKYGFWDSMVHRSKTRVMASGLSIPLLSIPASY
ncbi:universal stress protein [Flavobacterium sediminis]|uniref:Universal stress protein n=2 Tax=Flavobacteriaceae TaxID=49546 RepID=A0A2U8QXZ8_9FLAO|nr:universal stress protein [Flavobacterium sediminis]